MNLQSVIASLGDHIKDAVLIAEVGPAGEPGPQILWCNRAFDGITAYASGELAGKTLDILWGDEPDKTAVDTIHTGLRAGQPVRTDVKIRTEKGTPRWFDLNAEPVMVETRKPFYWVLTLHDVTDRKRQEHDLHLAQIERDTHYACLNARHKELCDAKARIEQIALHDPLTGLPNRLVFQERLNLALSSLRDGELAAIHLIDLDSFKTVNDTLGHPVGDRLLNWVAARLRRQVRGSDLIARIGGDEFAIIQVDLKSTADAISLAERVVQIGNQPFELNGNRLEVGVSAGVAIAPTDGLTADELLRHADLALYKSKAVGRGVFHFFENKMKDSFEAKRSMESEIRRAIINQEFALLFQPLVDSRRNEICGFEALIRWNHPSRGLVCPDDFIPHVEQMGLMGVIDEWLILAACSIASTWPDHIRLAINLSPAHLNRRSLPDYVAKVMKVAGLPAHRLEFEITESGILDSGETTAAILDGFRAMGIGLAMDDFGTGYSSLSSLQRHPFNRIKIDGSFVKRFLTDTQSAKIVRSVIGLASALGMSTTAEGIESPELCEALRREGCAELQGYFLGKPVPSRGVARLLRPGGAKSTRKKQIQRFAQPAGIIGASG